MLRAYMKTNPFAGKKLMTPGPVPMPENVRRSLMEIECHHRTKDFTDILNRVFENLPKVFQTKQHCYMLASTGTGAMEAAVVNTLCTDRKALFINAGKFGERWGKIFKAYGISFDEIQVEWGKDIDLNRVQDQLKQGDYQALAFQACETSTGALLPCQELGKICQDNSVLSIVDGITALGAVPLPMDEWGLDVVLGGSQKAFMLPTGMAFLSLSEKAEAVKSDLKSYYFNLKAEKAANLDGKTRYSTPTHFVIALDMVLNQMLFEVGLDKHLMNIQEKAQYFRDLISLPLFPETSSPSLTCMAVPEGVKASQVTKQVNEEGYVIMAGQDQLKDKVLRVGHMGDISKEDLQKTAQAIEKFL